ncbi:MAG: DUF6114 domain-containing protein [Candidatus Methylarchaceae archaeon HK02M2]|nr:DUF6114 domain-containing protein [Candidatus Methylarchaceae archaeon HK02M2]
MSGKDKDKVKPMVPFALSFTAGILILLGGVWGWVWMSGETVHWGNMPFGMMDEWMHGWEDMMHGIGFTDETFGIFSIIGLISGILILLSSVLLYSKPKDHIAWGIVIIIFSALSLFGMGGFVLGALLGLAGGILAIVWEHSK